MGRLLTALLGVSLALGADGGNITSLDRRPAQPFASAAQARVFLFVRTDCPISNRYAPELQRIAAEFRDKPVEFWLVYSDRSVDPAAVRQQIAQYQLPGTVLLDAHGELARRAEASVSPQAAVFNADGRLLYSGRIDDRYVDFGKARPQPETRDLEAAVQAVLDGKPVLHPRTRAVGCFLSDVQ